MPPVSLSSGQGFLERQLKRPTDGGLELDPGDGPGKPLYDHQALERNHAPLGPDQIVDVGLSGLIRGEQGPEHLFRGWDEIFTVATKWLSAA